MVVPVKSHGTESKIMNAKDKNIIVRAAKN